MELIYKVKKPETIKRFILENHIPSSILERDEKLYKIYVNNQIKSTKDTVRKGDKIHIHIVNEKPEKVFPQEMDLNIIYEDEYLLVVNKPANMRMMISKKHPKNTLANGISHYYQSKNIQAKLHFINRLDTDLSGLVVLAKHQFIRFLMSDKLDNEALFYYQAVVDGQIPQKNFSICLPIGKQKDSSLREVAEDGKECETKYQVIKEYKNFSLLDLQVKNKITHQIKVHLSYFDFPVVGDKYYNESSYPVDRVLMDCYKVKFTHPINEEEMNIVHEIPKEIIDFMKK
ncbi:MAG: RluA family pseudouridine synthase [Candidatus Izemoplasmatales bacterium]